MNTLLTALHVLAILILLASVGVAAQQAVATTDGAQASSDNSSSSSSSFWCTQPVDHFDQTNTQQWKQQYMVNATFYRTGGPIYMSTAGETPLTRNDVDNTYATELAAATGGMVVSVEHRFYGQSNPLPDLSGNSLKYLTVDNVLEDFASVVRAIKANETATNSTVIGLPVSVASESPVIFVGGSYPGAVAAWMRAKYPDLVAGAWSSAAAVYGRLENYQFDQGFGRHLKTAMVAGGGGSGCAECFAQAVADLDQILLSGDAARIAAVQERLGIPLLGTSDLANILTVLATIGALQPVTTVSDPVYSTVCVYFEKGLNQTTDTKGSGYSACLNSYIAMINGLVAQSGLTPPMLVALGNSSLAVDNTALNQPQRVWYYQMCTWFGMWQVAPPLMSNSSSSGLVGYRSQLLDLDYFQSSCPKKFGAQAKDPADVDSFNAKWFEILRNTSNVLYTSGSLDPWRDSTVDTSWGNLVDPPGASVVLTIDGATHAQDLQPSRSTDLLSVKQARMLGKRLVKQWVRQARRDSRHRYNC